MAYIQKARTDTRPLEILWAELPTKFAAAGVPLGHISRQILSGMQSWQNLDMAEDAIAAFTLERGNAEIARREARPRSLVEIEDKCYAAQVRYHDAVQKFDALQRELDRVRHSPENKILGYVPLQHFEYTQINPTPVQFETYDEAHAYHNEIMDTVADVEKEVSRLERAAQWRQQPREHQDRELIIALFEKLTARLDRVEKRIANLTPKGN